MKYTAITLLLVVSMCLVVRNVEGFNLFEFLERKFGQVKPFYHPPPRQPAPQWPRLQYNYDTPNDNKIYVEQEEEQQQQQQQHQQHHQNHYYQNPEVRQPVHSYSPPQHEFQQQQQQPQHHYYQEQQQQVPQYHHQQQQEYHQEPVYHYEYQHPEQPYAPVNPNPRPPTRPSTTTTSTPFYEYADIEIITAPPGNGHRHYGETLEVQVGVGFNTKY